MRNRCSLSKGKGREQNYRHKGAKYQITEACKLWRKRTVIQAPQGDGRQCPSQMAQWKPCLVKPCYSWRYSTWSECKSEGARCGEGLRFRNVSCFVSDGSGEQDSSLVDDDLCGDLEPSVDGDTRIVLQEPCTVPCPGECYLKDWTIWSPCQLSCVSGDDLGFGSVQVRSRAVLAQDPENLLQCPEQEMEARPCTDGQCFDYKWKTAPWRGSSRQVWCQRSDGVNVTGGCPATAMPMADRSCDPPCTKPRSLCTEVGVCGCEEGYTEVMTSTGQLDQCTVIPVLEIPTAGDNRADVKTIRAFNPTQPAASTPSRVGRTWFLQPFGPDGKLKTWVYGVAAGAFVLLVFIISMTYLACHWGCCLCCKSRSESASGGVYWMDPVPYTCPACQKLEQDELRQLGLLQQHLQQEQQYEAQLHEPPPLSQQQQEAALPPPPPHFETLIT